MWQHEDFFMRVPLSTIPAQMQQKRPYINLNGYCSGAFIVHFGKIVPTANLNDDFELSKHIFYS